MDPKDVDQNRVQEAMALAAEASDAARALERAHQAVEELIEARGALDEIAAIAYGIERSLVRATIAAEGIGDELREAAGLIEDVARRR